MGHTAYPIFSHCWSRAAPHTAAGDVFSPWMAHWMAEFLGTACHTCNLGGSLEDAHRFINHINLDGISSETGEQV